MQQTAAVCCASLLVCFVVLGDVCSGDMVQERLKFKPVVQALVLSVALADRWLCHHGHPNSGYPTFCPRVFGAFVVPDSGTTLGHRYVATP